MSYDWITNSGHFGGGGNCIRRLLHLALRTRVSGLGSLVASGHGLCGRFRHRKSLWPVPPQKMLRGTPNHPPMDGRIKWLYICTSVNPVHNAPVELNSLYSSCWDCIRICNYLSQLKISMIIMKSFCICIQCIFAICIQKSLCFQNAWIFAICVHAHLLNICMACKAAIILSGEETELTCICVVAKKQIFRRLFSEFPYGWFCSKTSRHRQGFQLTTHPSRRPSSSRLPCCERILRKSTATNTQEFIHSLRVWIWYTICNSHNPMLSKNQSGTHVIVQDILRILTINAFKLLSKSGTPEPTTPKP
jgi:hypothetical protein